jgi:hypothetical protein
MACAEKGLTVPSAMTISTDTIPTPIPPLFTVSIPSSFFFSLSSCLPRS